MTKENKENKESSNTYTQIVFNAEFETSQFLEDFVDFCSEAGALSISIEDSLADTDSEQVIYGEPGQIVELGWSKSKITILLDNTLTTENFFTELLDLSELDKLPNYTIEKIGDKDWVSITQSQFNPIPIGDKLLIVPSWHLEASVANQELINKNIINLDPGLAFGTGSHPTTNLCLQWIEKNINERSIDILDYGCGSGILAIAANKMGGKNIIGVDIDTQAVESARYNAKNNACNISFYQPDDVEWINYKPSTFNIVIANILSNPLKVMASLLSARVNSNGYLILSGILSRQAEEIKDAYKPYINLSVWQELEGWVCMVGRK